MSKKPRRFQLPDYRGLRDALEDHARLQEVQEVAEVDEVSHDTVKFLEKYCRLKPYWYLLDLIESYQKYQFNAVRWPRQTGKSTDIGALHLADAWNNDDLNIGFVGPSWRQTKLNIRRVASFCRNLPQQELHVQKTKIFFKNGSVIEAFPNNPDTIRGNTFHRIWWDEVNFTSNDEDLYDAILFTLGTTNGKLTASSTPFNTDALFWKMCNHKDYADFGRLHFSYEKALEPEGPLKPAIIEKIKKQFGGDPARWRREMEAEWAENEDVWLAQSLIVSCVGTVKNCGEDLQAWDPEKGYKGDLFAGLDLAQVRDYCVLSVFDRVNDVLFLRHLKIFQQPTKYANVLGYVKALQDRWGGFQKIRVDMTKDGPSLISDMENAGIKNVEGVNFSIPRKSEMASLFKQRMMNQKLFYPYLTWEKPYRGDVCSELNVERYELRKDGAINLSHPNGTHDDTWWSIALAVYGTVEMKAFDLEALKFG
ncbi:terminase family protein [Candidatus Bathyarchaeota archaeon]|nr:terminase family protein [Candidatus Bathyarchaeota archaeon]